jgi:DNA-binding NarL/FixJ family response regulator
VGVVTEAAATIRVLIADDDALVRAALSMILSATGDIEVVGEAADGDEVAAAVDTLHPQVVLMDIRMPRMDGLEATELLRARAGAPEVVVLTTFHADEYVLRALRVGASGFLLKDSPPAKIVEAIRSVADGDAMLSPSVTRSLISHVAESAVDTRQQAARAAMALLTDREREVAYAIGRGESNAQIGATLFMSIPTVKANVSRMLAKLDLNNRVQIALLANDAR